MAVDTAIYIGDFDVLQPPGTLLASELDDSDRQIKFGLVSTLPNLKGPMIATHTQLNHVAGVTSAIQPQIDSKGAIAGQTWTGTHSFTGAITVPTKSAGTGTDDASSCAFVQTAIAAVNSTSGNLVRSTNSAASFSVGAGQMVAATNSGAVAVTFPPSPTAGTVCGVIFDNGRSDNTVNLGANSVKGPNGVSFSGVMTVDQPVPVILAWYGDFWRAA